jgi:3-hydroxyanthranilate 3,4-dioxygenase
MQEDQPEDILIREGDILLLPANVPHSPRRPANTIGLVIERVRKPEEIEGFIWYCEHCNHKLYEERLHVSNIETQLQPVFARFYGSIEHRTCSQCNTVMAVPAGQA